MSIVPDHSTAASINGKPPCSSLVTTNGHHRHPSLHRIGAVRRQQGVSLRTVSRQWNVELAEVRRQQEECTDLPLSQLYRWQAMLGVPVADLLVEDEEPLSDPIQRRAQMVKIMKTAVTLRETALETRVKRLISTLIDQLTELMPELAEVGPWHGSGSRRTLDDYGRAAECRLTDDMLYG